MRELLILWVIFLTACSNTVSGSLKTTPLPKLTLPPATYLVHQRGQCLTIVNEKLRLLPCNGQENQQFGLRSDNAWVINRQCLAMDNQQAVTRPCQLPTAHGFGLGNERLVHYQSNRCAQASGSKVLWRPCDLNNAAQDFEFY